MSEWVYFYEKYTICSSVLSVKLSVGQIQRGSEDWRYLVTNEGV